MCILLTLGMAILLQNKHAEKYHHQQQPLCVTNTHGQCFPHDCNKTHRLCVLMTQLEPQQLNITHDTRICNLNSEITSKKKATQLSKIQPCTACQLTDLLHKKMQQCSCWYPIDSSGEQTAARERDVNKCRRCDRHNPHGNFS